MEFERTQKEPGLASQRRIVSREGEVLDTELERSVLLKTLQLAESQGVFLAISGTDVLVILSTGSAFEIQLVGDGSTKTFSVDDLGNLTSVMNTPVQELDVVHAPMVDALNRVLTGLTEADLQAQEVRVGESLMLGRLDVCVERLSKTALIKELALLLGGKSGFNEVLPSVVKELEGVNPANLDSSLFEKVRQDLQVRVNDAEVDPDQIQKEAWRQHKHLIDERGKVDPAATIALTKRYREITGDPSLEAIVSSVTDNAHQVSDGTTIFSSELLRFVTENYSEETAQQIVDDILLHEHRHYTFGHGSQLNRLLQAATALIGESSRLHEVGKTSYGEMKEYQLAVKMILFAEKRALESQADGDALLPVTVEAFEKFTGGHGSAGFFDTHPPIGSRGGQDRESCEKVQ